MWGRLLLAGIFFFFSSCWAGEASSVPAPSAELRAPAGEPEASSVPVRRLLDQAVQEREEGKLRSAAELFLRAAELPPGDPHIFNELGWTWFYQREDHRALEAWDKALRLDSRHPLALLGKGIYELEHSSSPWPAVFSLDKITRVWPDFAPAYYYLGKTYEVLEKWPQALQMYERTPAEDFSFQEVRLPWGRLLEKLGRTDEAWKQYVKILDLDSSHPEALKGKNRLAPLLSKKPEDLLPAAKITSAAHLVPVPQRGEPVFLRVGLGTSASGNPVLRKSIQFWSGGRGFEILKKSSGKPQVLQTGAAQERWKIVAAKKTGFCWVFSPAGKRLGPYALPLRLELLEPDRSTFILEEVRYGQGFPWTGRSDREYRGNLELFWRGGGFYLVNLVSLEEYLYSVLPSEMEESFPMEALKSQAVLARTQALYRKKSLQPHRKHGYDLCDDQHCQVYRGVRKESRRTSRAVEETWGEVLGYEGKLVHGVYHSTCGGMTHPSEQVWRARVPYLKGVLDGDPSELKPPEGAWEMNQWIKYPPPAFCGLRRYVHPSKFRWLRVIPKQELERNLDRAYRTGRLLGLRVLERASSGHLRMLLVQGSRRSVTIGKEHLMRRHLGLGPLRSSVVSIEARLDGQGEPSEFFVYGAGWGHGVGLCQSGAAGRAHLGRATHEQILKAYFPGTQLEKYE
ncbi:MAG: SpoIID/LytB domain-containing protein [Elusimicrobia bacterium]|nr:SpoIID/LytB domain-containing protein [Elusimicrobiota bacterium]